MNRFLKRLVLGVAVFLVLAVSTVAIAVVARENRTFDAPYPDVHASTDPAVIARGQYLATGPAHCTACHGPDLAGGLAFELPIGTVYARNLTPAGLGRYTDPEIARALRYGVHPSGRAMLPFMPYADMTDEDLTAVVSYLRTRPAVDHAVPANRFNWLGRAARAFVLVPKGPSMPVRTHIERGPTIEYGTYLATTIANCTGCHTRHNHRTGAQEGVAFAGGMTVESHYEPGATFVAPNLTPDPASGHIYAWSEDVFIARFRNPVPTASPMPWGELRHLTDDDLRALYRYLRSLPPARTGEEL